MAKKFVRGVTGVDDIEKFDKSLTNVNDLISDGQDTYVHTKKGKNEFYYKVTDGVTSVNSTGGTINVEKSEDGTVNLNTNPQKVLEHDNLVSSSEYVTIEHDEGSNTSEIKTGKLNDDMNQLYSSLAQKQNKLSSGDGISILGDTISLKIFDKYKGNLNDLTYTCLVKPDDSALNIPAGAYGNGILTVVRIGDVVSQKYHYFIDNNYYVRTCRGLPENQIWSDWLNLRN